MADYQENRGQENRGQEKHGQEKHGQEKRGQEKRGQEKRGLVETTDGYVHYRSAGAGDPLVLLHQVPLSSVEFCDVMPALAAKRQVIAIDLPSYGASDAPQRSFTVEDFAASVLQVLDALAIQTADILGVHTGAAVANVIAAQHPQRVKRLILNGAPAWPNWQQRYESFARCNPFEMDAEMTELKAQWARLYAMNDNQRLIRRFIQEKLKASPIWYLGYVAVFTHDFAECFARVTAPTLLLTGSHDMLADFTPSLLRLRPTVKESLVVGGGNFLAWEQPERFIDEVEQFLS